jgi:hypothetical protein
MITIIQVCRDIGVEPNPELTWAVGAAVRNRYIEKTGESPLKQLRPKTDGQGSHCFAIYPNDWHSDIADIIRAHGAEAAKQIDMFRGT